MQTVLWCLGSAAVAGVIGFLLAALMAAGKLDDALKEQSERYVEAINKTYDVGRAQLTESHLMHAKTVEVLLQGQREIIGEQRKDYETQMRTLQDSLEVSHIELRKALERAVAERLPVHDGSEEVSVDEADRRAAVALDAQMINAE